MLQMGQRDKPHIMALDVAFLERKKEFYLQYVQGIALPGPKRNRWQICIVISMQDSNLQSAVIHYSRDPASAYCMILIKGTSRGGWLTEHAAFGKKIKVEATTEHYRETVAKIHLDDKGKVKY
jgi:hypothetical protein